MHNSFSFLTESLNNDIRDLFFDSIYRRKGCKNLNKFTDYGSDNIRVDNLPY